MYFIGKLCLKNENRVKTNLPKNEGNAVTIRSGGPAVTHVLTHDLISINFFRQIAE